MTNLWSILALPALVIVWMTALSGLNDIRPHSLRNSGYVAALMETGLGLSFLAMGMGSTLMLIGTAAGANIYTWRGCVLMWGVAGVFFFIGKFAPWRRWIRRMADMESMTRKWKEAGSPDVKDIAELVEDGRRALRAKASERASECVRILPKLIFALEHVAAREAELREVQEDLSDAVSLIRDKLKEDGALEPDAARRVNEILDKIERAIGDE